MIGWKLGQEKSSGFISIKINLPLWFYLILNLLKDKEDWTLISLRIARKTVSNQSLKGFRVQKWERLNYSTGRRSQLFPTEFKIKSCKIFAPHCRRQKNQSSIRKLELFICPMNNATYWKNDYHHIVSNRLSFVCASILDLLSSNQFIPQWPAIKNKTFEYKNINEKQQFSITHQSRLFHREQKYDLHQVKIC